ncbi:Gag polyprotein [Bienertia sinuspersici]
MAAGSSGSVIDPTSHLYLHPSDGTNFINVEKLTGASNYRAWRRSFEIALTSKRKLGFVTGGVRRDKNDKVKQECWDTCNNMVISWILASVTDPIKKSMMFMNDACYIRKQLEKSYSINNGAKKYNLNRQLYETKQQGKPISEYYTLMKGLEIFKHEKEDADVMAMYTKKAEVACKKYGKSGHLTEKCWACRACGKTGHSSDKCWTVIGFPSKNSRSAVGKGKEVMTKGQQHKGTQRWTKGRQNVKQELEANSYSKGEVNASAGITAEQLEQLLKLLPTPSKGEDTDMPNGSTTAVQCSGEVELNNGLKLKRTVYAPDFKHNILSFQKLAEQENCKVIFHSNFCIIQDLTTSEIRGLGRVVRGVYYLMNEPVKDVLKKLS